MFIIGLGNSKRVGKDSLAEYLRKRLNRMGINAAITHFADKVKTECTADFVSMFPNLSTVTARGVLTGAWRQWCIQKGIRLGAPVELDFSDPLCPLGKCRQALQWWGTDYRRAQDEHYWVRKVDNTARVEKEKGTQVLFIPDTRFWDEADYIHESKGQVWKIKRVYPAGEEPPFDPHPSEHALDGYAFDNILVASSIPLLYLKGEVTFDREWNKWKSLN